MQKSSNDIVAFTDNSFTAKIINKDELILCDTVQDVMGIIIQIRAETKSSPLQIRVEYSNRKPKRNERFEDNLGAFLIRQCDHQVRKVRAETQNNEIRTDLLNSGQAILIS